MTGSPFDGLGKHIFESMKRTLTRRTQCTYCKKTFWLWDTKKDHLGRYWCKPCFFSYFRESAK